jgi:hypothetical protein
MVTRLLSRIFSTPINVEALRHDVVAILDTEIRKLPDPKKDWHKVSEALEKEGFTLSGPHISSLPGEDVYYVFHGGRWANIGELHVSLPKSYGTDTKPTSPARQALHLYIR